MKAIITRYHGPTSTRGSRISARAEGCPTRFIPYDYSRGAEGSHDDAAHAYAEERGWLTTGSVRWRLEGGGLPDGTGNAYVFVKVEG